MSVARFVPHQTLGFRWIQHLFKTVSHINILRIPKLFPGIGSLLHCCKSMLTRFAEYSTTAECIGYWLWQNMHNCSLQLKASSNTLKDPSYIDYEPTKNSNTRPSLLRYTLWQSVCHRPTITDDVIEPQHLAVLRQRFSAARLRPNSIMLSGSQTWFPIWLPTSSCGSATSYFVGLKAGCRQVRAISTCLELEPVCRSVTWIA